MRHMKIITMTILLAALAVPGTASAEWVDPWTQGKGFDDPWDQQQAQAMKEEPKAQAQVQAPAKPDQEPQRAEAAQAQVQAPANAEAKDPWVLALPGAVQDKDQQQGIIKPFSNQ